MPPTDDNTSKATPRKRTAKKAEPQAIVTRSPVAPAESPNAPLLPEDPYAPSTWGSASTEDGPQDLIVPSGQKCLVRRPGVETLLREGVLFESDTLTTLVHENIERIEKGLPQKDVDMEAMLADPAKFAEVMNTTDRIVCAVVLKPAVMRAPNDITNRKPSQIYTDMVALEDKFAILEFALGGTRALADFRIGSESVVGSVRTRQSTSGPTKRPPRRKR